MKYVEYNGYKVYPVNPTIRGEKILGEKVYAKVSEINGQVDIIDVFRPSNEAVEIANEAVKIKAKVLWLQLDIKSPEAKKFKALEDKIAAALLFMEACGFTSDFNNRLYVCVIHI